MILRSLSKLLSKFREEIKKILLEKKETGQYIIFIYTLATFFLILYPFTGRIGGKRLNFFSFRRHKFNLISLLFLYKFL